MRRFGPLFQHFLLLSCILLSLTNLSYCHFGSQQSSNFRVFQGNFVPAQDSRFVYSGRVHRPSPSESSSIFFDWPCISFNFTLQPSWNSLRNYSFTLILRGGKNVFLVFLNGEQHSRIDTITEEAEYSISFSSSSQVEVSIFKITEASSFIFQALLPLSFVEFKGLLLSQDLSLVRSSTWTQGRRKIEILGDSASNGFGIDSPDEIECILSLREIQNCHKSWSHLVSTYFDAELHLEAWSGKGVVKNAADFFRESSDPMPIYWNRTLATNSSLNWDFQTWIPDIVVVYLGSNDYYNYPYPENEQFTNKYVDTLQQILRSYQPSKKLPILLNVCGGTLASGNVPCPHVQNASQTFQSLYKNTYYYNIPPDLLKYPDDFGCLDHRNDQGNVKFAGWVIQLISKIMGW